MTFRLFVRVTCGCSDFTSVHVYKDFSDVDDFVRATDSFIRAGGVAEKDVNRFSYHAENNGWCLAPHDSNVDDADCNVTLSYAVECDYSLNVYWAGPIGSEYLLGENVINAFYVDEDYAGLANAVTNRVLELCNAESI